MITYTGHKMEKTFKNVDEYINSFPEKTRELLKQIRAVIKLAAPDAEEGITYGMPAYKTYGRPLLYFAGFSKHIGFYATPSGHSAFSEELSKYRQGKGSVQFPLDKPLPLDLIAQMTEFRVIENSEKFKK
jgi:uncharacterized protein YdhG (YjbR/CyaY superfamily)